MALNSTASGCDAVNGTVTCDPQVSHLTFLKMIVYQRKTKVSVSFQSFNSTNYPECPSARCIFITYNEEGLFQRNLFNLQIYNAIAFLWCVNFVIALGQCTLAGAFASYYWAFNKPDDIPFFPVTGSFLRSLRYVTNVASVEAPGE